MSLYKNLNPLLCSEKELAAFEAKIAFLPNSQWSDFMAKAEKTVLDVHNEEVLQLLAKFWAKYFYVMYKIQKAESATKRKKYEDHLFRSVPCRLIAVIRGYSKKAKMRKVEGFLFIATKADPRKSSHEAVNEFYTRKPGRKTRGVYRYGPRERGKQTLVRDWLLAFVGPSKYEYAIFGKGRLKAIKEAERIIKALRDIALGTIDFKECFASINMEAIISAIDLPVSIVVNTILEKRGVKAGGSYLSVSSLASLKKPQIQTKHCDVLGLPHGSICSTLIAGLVIEKILDRVIALGLIAHVDDILVIGKTKKDVGAIYKAIEQVSKEIYPNTPLVMKFNSPVKLGERMNFLGCWFSLKGRDKSGRVYSKPSEKSIRLAYVKAAHIILESDIDSAEEIEAKLDNYFKRWAGSMPFWPFRKKGYSIGLTCFISACLDTVDFAKLALKLYLSRTALTHKEIANLKLDVAEYIVPQQVLETNTKTGIACRARKIMLFYGKDFDNLVKSKVKCMDEALIGEAV